MFLMETKARKRFEITGRFVDIMVKSSQIGARVQRERVQVIRFVKEHMLRQLQAFCASPRGCPGIRFLVSIIRCSSVQTLIPIHQRRAPEHCVQLESLKREFQLSIERMLQEAEGDVDTESLSTFRYSWQTGGTELAKDVLDHGDLMDVLSRVLDKMKNSEAEVQTNLTELRGIFRKMCRGEEMRTCSGEESNLTVDHNPAGELQLTEAQKYLADEIDSIGI